MRDIDIQHVTQWNVKGSDNMKDDQDLDWDFGDSGRVVVSEVEWSSNGPVRAMSVWLRIPMNTDVNSRSNARSIWVLDYVTERFKIAEDHDLERES